MLKYLLVLFISLALSNQVTITWRTWGNVIEVYYDSNDDITGFQFNAGDVNVMGAYSQLPFGGGSGYGNIVFAGHSQAYLPAGHGTLCVIVFSEMNEACMNGLVVVGSDLQKFDIETEPGCLND